MGGYGSGRQGWLPVIENGLKLDLRRMRKHGQFVNNANCSSGSLVWSYTHTGERSSSKGFAYCSHGNAPWFRVNYTVTRYDDEKVSEDERFQLERFPQPYGGHRWHFICPQTARRAQCLYLPPGATRFRSRHGFRCRLQYRSQCEDKISRLSSQMHKVSDKMKESGPREWQERVKVCDFPSKPPGMHWRTYERWFDRWEAYDKAWNHSVGPWLASRPEMPPF